MIVQQWLHKTRHDCATVTTKISYDCTAMITYKLVTTVQQEWHKTFHDCTTASTQTSSWLCNSDYTKRLRLYNNAWPHKLATTVQQWLHTTYHNCTTGILHKTRVTLYCTPIYDHTNSSRLYNSDLHKTLTTVQQCVIIETSHDCTKVITHKNSSRLCNNDYTNLITTDDWATTIT